MRSLCLTVLGLVTLLSARTLTQSESIQAINQIAPLPQWEQQQKSLAHITDFSSAPDLVALQQLFRAPACPPALIEPILEESLSPYHGFNRYHIPVEQPPTPVKPTPPPIVKTEEVKREAPVPTTPPPAPEPTVRPTATEEPAPSKDSSPAPTPLSTPLAPIEEEANDFLSEALKTPETNALTSDLIKPTALHQTYLASPLLLSGIAGAALMILLVIIFTLKSKKRFCYPLHSTPLVLEMPLSIDTSRILDYSTEPQK